MKIQKLITKEIESKLPRLYTQENSDDPIVHVRFFTPYGGLTFLVTEYTPGDEAFGYVYNNAHPEGAELGYINVDYLQGLRAGPFKLQAVERDIAFRPMPLSEAAVRYCPGSRRAEEAKAAKAA